MKNDVGMIFQRCLLHICIAWKAMTGRGRGPSGNEDFVDIVDIEDIGNTGNKGRSIEEVYKP